MEGIDDGDCGIEFEGPDFLVQRKAGVNGGLTEAVGDEGEKEAATVVVGKLDVGDVDLDLIGADLIEVLSCDHDGGKSAKVHQSSPCFKVV